MYRATGGVIAVLLFSLAIFAQQSQTQNSDPHALSLVVRASNAMTGGATFRDATLTGTAIRTPGSHAETGTAVLRVRSGAGSRLDLSLPKGQRTEIYNGQSEVPKGSWSGHDQVSHRAPLHNCWVDASWYFPPVPLASMISDPQLVLSYMGRETRDGVAVEHLRASRHLRGQSAAVTALVQKLSTIDLYLDATSALPVAVTFNGHPDNDAGTNLPAEIRFANYQAVNGAQLPMEIEKLINGGAFLKISFSNIVPNSGLPDAHFQVQ